MSYTRQELDWIEAEWAFHLHGRTAFLSREDFTQLMAWADQGITAEAIVAAMETYFERRTKRAKPRSFVALSHLEKDVAKAMQLRKALARGESEAQPVEALAGWDQVKAPLAEDPKARAAFGAWKVLAQKNVSPDSPGFLEHHDAERRAFHALVALAEGALGPRCEPLQQELRGRMVESKVPENTPVWKLAWEHHWGRIVCAQWGIPL